MEIYKIYPVPAADASTAFQVELDPNAIAAEEYKTELLGA